VPRPRKDYNMSFSERRAKAIFYDLLVSSGVDGSRLSFKGTEKILV